MALLKFAVKVPLVPPTQVTLVTEILEITSGQVPEQAALVWNSGTTGCVFIALSRY